MKNVMIKIESTQNFGTGNTDSVELTTAGTFEQTEKEIIITYEESELTGMKGTTTKVLMDKNGIVTLARKGTTNSQLIFEEGKKHISYYDTEAGAFSISVFSNYVEINIEGKSGEMEIAYILEVDGTTIGKNEIRMEFQIEE